MRRRLSAPRTRTAGLVVGHSLGGAAVLAAAGKIPEARAIATVGAPAEPDHVKHLFANAKTEIEKTGEAEVLLAGRPFKIKKQFLDDIAENRLAESIAAMNKALIIFHSVADKTVGIDNARKIYQAARHPKSFISLDGADHLLTDKRDALYVSNVLAAWAELYLHTPAAAKETQTHGDDSTVVVTEVGETDWRSEFITANTNLSPMNLLHWAAQTPDLRLTAI